MLRAARAYSKQFAVLVTDFTRNYRYDPFYRSEINIIALQGSFAILLLCIVGAISTQLYLDASYAVSKGMSVALTPHATPSEVGTVVVHTLTESRSRTLQIAVFAVVLVTIIFTYVITRVALAPTRKALESQKRFIGNIAHELRTPLAIIKTNTEVRLLDPNLQKDVADLFQENLEELDRISEIINNLLTLSGSFQMERIEIRSVDLGEAVRSSLEKLKPLADTKNIQFNTILSEWRSVKGNPTAIEQIVTNILRNAIIYSDESGDIRVSVEPLFPNFTELTIHDSGRGITLEDLSHIFEPFYRGDPSRQRAGAGSGLGLSIVAELVKFHGGKITVRSAEGRGTTVTVLLPSASRDAAMPEAELPRTDASEVSVDFSNMKNT